MACTESTWACEPSSIIGVRPNYPPCSSCGSDDRPCVQDGQAIDVQPSAASSSVEKYHKITRFHGRSWQDSFDFQQVGFSYNVADVAPADELFFKGQILPLQTDTRLHVVQSLSSCCDVPEELIAEVPEHAGRPSSVNRDDHEVRFNSCRIEGAMYDKATSSNIALGGMRSLSFRSHHSGYWESGGEKDTTDTSYSSSRDSSGSSQDSYFPNASTKSHSHLYIKVKPSLIPWKSFFGGLVKVSRQHNPSPPLPIVAFSEDLSKYRPVADESFADARAGSAPILPGKDVEQERSGVIARKFAVDHECRSHGGLKGKPVLLSDGGVKGALTSISASKAGGEDSKANSKSGSSDMELQQTIITPQCYKEGSSTGTMKVKFPRLSKGRSKSKCPNTDVSKGVKIATSRDPEGPKHRRSAVKERWQGYARKLKPLYEVKKGLMGQFRMDECGKNACEVESGIVRRPSSWQRKLSHQSSFFKNHKQSMEREENEAGSPAYNGSSNNIMQVAMSSCPPSTRSSPNHSGVLASVADNKAKLHQSGGNPNHVASKKVVSNECMSMSTMHELHSAVQSAIAHCKESNRRGYLG